MLQPFFNCLLPFFRQKITIFINKGFSMDYKAFLCAGYATISIRKARLLAHYYKIYTQSSVSIGIKLTRLLFIRQKTALFAVLHLQASGLKTLPQSIY